MVKYILTTIYLSFGGLFMIYFAAAIVMVLIIAVSYLADRKYPRRRSYIIPTGIILLCSVAAALSWLTPVRPAQLSEEQRLAILNEQPYFITWYNDYKQIVTQLDRYCSTYHKIIGEYEDGTLSAPEAQERLNTLYNNTAKYDQGLQELLPPSELSQKNYTLTYNILEKTRVYSYKINETTRQSISVISRGNEEGLDKQYIVNNLNRIYTLEGPIILDINTEVTQLKDNLTLID